MRIGIVTVPFMYNHGGFLQAYALQTVLERMGHSVVVLSRDFHKSLPLKMMPLLYAYRLALKMKGLESRIFYEQKHNKEFPIISQYMMPFIEKYIHRRIVKDDMSGLKEKDFDAIVVGSDIIWNSKSFRKKNAYLHFAKSWHIRRFSYAASFGEEEWGYTPKQTKQCGLLLKMFDAVSVREDSAVRLCKEHFGVDALHVLDPTMLLSTSDYIHLIEQAKIDTNIDRGGIACYILSISEEKKKLIDQLSSALELTATHCLNSYVDYWCCPVNERIQTPVELWLQGFRDAKIIVTDSFHACVFAILFNKPFVAIITRYATRIESLLRVFDLECCRYSKEWSYESLMAINWNKVNDQLAEWRRISFDFLKQIK